MSLLYNLVLVNWQWRSNGLCRLCNAQGPPAIWGAPSNPAIQGAPSNSRGPMQPEGPSAIWSAKNNLRGPISLRGPSNLRGQQYEGPQQSEWPLTICMRGPRHAIWRASDNLWRPIYLRGPQQFEGPQQSEWHLAIWGALSNLKVFQQSESPINMRTPSNLKGPSSLKGPQQSEGPSPIWGPPAIEGWTHESCYHFAQAFVQCCQRGQPFSKLLNCSLTIMLCHLHSVMSVLPTCCRLRCQWLLRHSNNHFQNWSSLKLYEVPCQKSGWATWQCG